MQSGASSEERKNLKSQLMGKKGRRNETKLYKSSPDGELPFVFTPELLLQP